MNRILSAISFMSRVYNNSRIINKFIRQIKFINHEYKREDELFVVNLEKHKFPFRQQFMTGSTFIDVTLAEFSFYIENKTLFIRFHDDEFDSISENFPTFISMKGIYITEKSYLYKKVKRSLVPIIREIKYRHEIHQKMIEFNHKLKDLEIVNPPPIGSSSVTSISRKKTKPSNSYFDYSNPSSCSSSNNYLE